MKYTAEQKSRLNPEQLKIVETYEQQEDERKAIFKKVANTVSEEEHAKCMEELLKVLEAQSNGTSCPHGRSLAKHCFDCEEIDRLLFPERVCVRCNTVTDPDELNPELVCISCEDDA